MSDVIKNLLKYFPDLVILSDLKGQIIDISQSVLDLYNTREKEQIIGKHILEFIHPESREIARKLFDTSQESEILKNLELKLLLDENLNYIGQITSILIKDEKQKHQYFLTIIKNITETKKILDELNRSKQMFQLVLDNIPQFIFWKDKDSRFLGCNKNFARVAGIGTPENVIGKLDKDLAWKKEEADTFFEIDRYVLESNEPEYHIIEPQFQADGKQAWLDTNKIPLHNSEGNVMGLLGTYEDITDRINAEIALKESEKSYRDAYNRANFLRDLFSHDMNNILQGIQSCKDLIEVYLNSEDIDGINKVKRILSNEIKRGVRLIMNIRTFSQLESEIEDVYIVNIYELITNSKQYILEKFQDKIITIDIDSKEKQNLVRANVFLVDVFQNIFINSILYNTNPEILVIIKISLEKQNNTEYVKVEVIDNGKGVEDDRKEIIFQRTENVDKQITGLGLGLSLSKKIIETFNGRFWVEDRVKGDHTKGSNFIILLPKAEE